MLRILALRWQLSRLAQGSLWLLQCLAPSHCGGSSLAVLEARSDGCSASHPRTVVAALLPQPMLASAATVTCTVVAATLCTHVGLEYACRTDVMSSHYIPASFLLPHSQHSRLSRLLLLCVHAL